jgi:hypothetical protein
LEKYEDMKLVAILGQGETFGELGFRVYFLIQGTKREATVVTKSRCSIAVFNHSILNHA